MRFHEEYEYPADVETVFAIFADPEFIESKYAAIGSNEAEIQTNDASADGQHLVVRRVVQMNVPGFAKKVLKPENTIIQTEKWGAADADGGRSGTWEADAVGVPSTTGGTLRLEPTDGGCIHHVIGEVKVNIPLIGGKIADFAGGQALEQIRAEAEFTKQWIADHAG
ncbi:MAG TPA: DUF2505 domain-containing protein [Marmoricola sp.]|nr:DUF2505 domain-containing protein [Marmoricola sp.]HNO40380.1 DUF2505 domain-containing protein [Marmoricola sp.]